MARLNTRVEATEESTQQRDFGNVPDGDYRLEISASDVAIKNEGSSDQAVTVKVTYDIVEPEDFKGRKLFNNFNVEHPKQQAQEIGQRQFSCQLRALGMTESPEDTEDLHFISFMAAVGMGKDSKEKNDDGSAKYAARNEIKKYYYPDQGEMPEPNVKAGAAAPVARVHAPANDNRQAAAPAKAAGSKPWGAARK